MNKKIALICALIIVVSLSITIVPTAVNGTAGKTDISVATVNTNAESQTETTAQNALGGLIGGGEVGGIVESLAGSGILDEVVSSGSSLIGGGSDGSILGGSGGSILGGLLGDKTTASQTVAGTYNIAPITPVITGAQDTQAAESVPQATDVPQTATPGETVDYAATSNPYKKPAEGLKKGDTGDGVKWMQWIFIFTHYGLPDNGITGVYDDNTEAVVKKLQQENNMTIDGIATAEVIDKVDLLLYKYKFGEDTTARYIAPSATVADTVGAQQTDSDSGSSNLKTIIIVIVAVWVVAFAAVLLVFYLKKKKLAKDIKNLDNAEASEKAAKDSGETELISDENDNSEKDTNESFEETKTEQVEEKKAEGKSYATVSSSNTVESGGSSIADLIAEANSREEKKSKRKKK